MKTTLEKILNGESLKAECARGLFGKMIDEDTPRELVAAILAALRAKGESSDEVRGFAEAMRQNAVKPEIDTTDAIDVVGTGGDGSGSLNISTGVALLAAAAGLPVIKHGNSSISSRSGSADVLRELGLPIPLDPTQAGEIFDRCGFTFLFAPCYHPAMAAIGPVRKALGVRTIFNILGPLTNPAKPKFGLIGAFSADVAALMAEALSGMAIDRVFVVHGAQGWDEATPVGPFKLWDVRPGAVTAEQRDPADYGLAACRPQDLAGGDAAYNAREMNRVLRGETGGHHRTTLILGAALSLELAGRVASVHDGLDLAASAIDDGRAATILEEIASSAGARA